MFSLSRKSMLAMEAVVDIAHHGRSQPVPSREFSERLGISRRHLEPVLQALVREGILKSIRGPRGGYILARERRRISLGDIVRAAGSASDTGPVEGSPLCNKIINPVVANATAAAADALDEVALSDIMMAAEERGFLPDLEPAQDFSI
ncbi:MAG: Rrf2 family transcriptional regulator [Tepidamorphaceae bacterium]|nr:Rrf2 family transcriptional regulator [Rhodobiaceae bacterium]MCC0049532.1 Rrf2 family transcriptional regulator [Rhodobiaceae bacterium]